jgi:hypothetical protein
MKPDAVHRYISVFSKISESHVDDLEFLEQPDIAFLQTIFLVDVEDPMYDEYPIDLLIAAKLAPLIQKDFEFEKFDYFLSCDSV